MRRLPEPDPGLPDTRSATRYLFWLVRKQWTSMTLGAFWGVVWMLSQALMPAAIGKAIDVGVSAKDSRELWHWSLVVFGLGCLTGLAGILRHRCAVTNWLAAGYRTVQLTAQRATELGATLPGRIGTGDVVAIGTADASSIGATMDVSARFVGAVVSIVVVAVLLLRSELRIGLTVLIGVPLIMALVGPLLKPMHRRQSEVRALQGKLTGRANDIVAGLRVLRGIGGEPEFADRYRTQSQSLRFAGVRVARVESVLDSAQVLLPGLFVVGVTWLAARLALSHDITAGQLVAFYGYAAFLVVPLQTITEAWGRFLRAHVAAGKVVRVLALQHPLAEDSGSAGDAEGTGALADEHSGLRLKPGSFTAVAAADSAEAMELADRLGRYRAAEGVTLDGVPLETLPLDRVRQRVLVADNDARLFAGRLADELAGPGGADADGALTSALHTAAAEDIIEALPEGLDAVVAERGRSFSGGQQQRLRLARALLADPEVLLLVEPTSAVDAHTEARIAERLAAARAGRTTVVFTTSPLMLDRAERVVFLAGGRAAAEGRHRELLATVPAYRATVTREED
ncbi:ABC transporter ATP-binding protein [Catenulispora sp. NF23]|uniref:ABC transporter ATP-binding protein n=1 Tax=Catenulispora pinistramenti TaxID=2705254 RepID=A0ABS5KTB0_9ACTN|nr:ABC transporter ATP-binding protein [Catenulispora pinistramenti]MBS2534190.1 ABC transporter ATP-binding protein [Catenulispora pinistramenti]MBS2549264.1 ABC transporter ATP-binding protein [Catenulispora pinistramenti]